MASAPRWAGAWTTDGPDWARAPGPGTRASASTEVVRSQGVPRRGPVTGNLLRRIADAHVEGGRVRTPVQRVLYFHEVYVPSGQAGWRGSRLCARAGSRPVERSRTGSPFSGRRSPGTHAGPAGCGGPTTRRGCTRRLRPPGA